MAQDVNQSETEVAAQVRSALVARISQERFELWMPADCEWSWADGALTLSFPTEFARQIAKRMLQDDLRAALSETVGSGAALQLQVSDAAATAPLDRSAEVLSGARADARSDASTAPVAVAMLARSSAADETHSSEAASTNRTIPMRDFARAERTSSAAPSGSMASRAAEQSAGSADNAAAAVCAPSTSGENAATAARSRADFWSDFVPGSSSQLAWTTINLIANEPGRMTPALVHGPFGVGKSHLASALAQRLRSQRRQRRVLHITAEQFTNDFTEAIRGSGLPMLRRKYRDVDTLILDDLQFLVGKKATINELRHTLDNLLKSGRQVVFFADRSPADLEALGSDFVGRLRGGLVSPLLPLDEDTRYQILKRDLRAAEVAVSDDIVLQIAARAIGDGRLLKGIVKRLMAASYIREDKLTWDECWNAIYDLIQGTQPIVRLGDIERVVCEVFGLEPNSLQSDRKTRSVSQPRMLAMFLARKYTPAAYQEIGDFFGHRRHSTVISAEKTVGNWLEDNAKLQLPRGSLAIREAMRHVEANLHVG